MNSDDGPEDDVDDPGADGVAIPGRQSRLVRRSGESAIAYAQRAVERARIAFEREAAKADRQRGKGLGMGGGPLATPDQLLGVLSGAALSGDVAAAVKLLDVLAKRGGGESIRAGRDVPDEALIASIESRARGRAG
jgi:hypothetical protein